MLKSRVDYHLIRLAVIGEKIFSHTQTYARPKLHASAQNQHGATTVNHVDSIVGVKKPQWVFGFLTQKEDTFWYLEDQTFSIHLIIGDQLEYADPDAFFTENCILMCKGYHQESAFVVTRIMHPPMRALDKTRMKINEQDYFGAYAKLQKELALKPIQL